MANNDWDRTVINTLERPLSSDINQAQGQLDRTVRDYLSMYFTGRSSDISELFAASPPSGFLGDSFSVRPQSPAAMEVVITKGLGFQDSSGDVPTNISGVTGLNDLSRYKPLPLLANALITGIANGPAGPNSRIDIVEVKVNRRLNNSLSRDVFDIGTGQFNPTLVNKTLDFTMDGSTSLVTSPSDSTGAIGYKMGAPGNPPSAPATSPGYMKIAEIAVGTLATTITAGMIKDLRPLLFPGGICNLSAQFQAPYALVPSVPVLSNVAAPPGVKIVVRSIFGGFFMQVYVFAGAGFTAGQCSASGLSSVSGKTFLNNFGNQPLTAGTLSAGDVTALADPAQSHPATSFALGQPVNGTVLLATALDTSVSPVIPISAAALPDPFKWGLVATLRR